MTIQLPADVVERIRKAVFWTPGETLAWLVQRAVEEYIDKLEEARGELFPERTGSLKPGRPLKSTTPD